MKIGLTLLINYLDTWDSFSSWFSLVESSNTLNIYIFFGIFLSKYLLLFENIFVFLIKFWISTRPPHLSTPIYGQDWNKYSEYFSKQTWQIYFHTFVGNSFKIKWTPLGLQRYQKGMGNEIFCLENHARINLPCNQIHV